jgi:hypothetical protein
MADDKAEPSIANERGEIFLPLDGQRYWLRPSHAAIEAAEKDTGKSLAELTNLAHRQSLSIAEQAVVAQEMMKAWGRANPEDEMASSHSGANRKRVAELIYEAGAISIQPRLAVLLTLALTGGVDASGEMKAVAKKTGDATAE